MRALLQRARRLLAALALMVCALAVGATWARSRVAAAEPGARPPHPRAPPDQTDARPAARVPAGRAPHEGDRARELPQLFPEPFRERGRAPHEGDRAREATRGGAAPGRAPASATGPPGEPAVRRRPCPGAATRHRRLAGVLNLNTATSRELELLPAIGPSKAARILAWRERHGRFRRLRDLRRVRGIGRKTLRRLASHLTIDKPTTLHLE